tara:strand:+ start:1043 stop:1153 length:111 start_codon:yes stop_codon:yes gene_type:complete
VKENFAAKYNHMELGFVREIANVDKMETKIRTENNW